LIQLPVRKADVDRSTFAAFVVPEEAFVKVDWKLCFSTLKDTGVDWNDRHLILNLYKVQTTVIELNESNREAKIRKNSKVSMPIVPYLLSLFI